ncbi:MAG: PAS domain-containing sensor histidine kinase [Actinomycetota bacterium]|nr:PAS domain-containing sensor histidine kinase [Actinomycetota bacterium]
MAHPAGGAANTWRDDVEYLRAELYERITEDSTLFDFLHESSLDGIWYYDTDSLGTRIWVSKRFEEVFGYGPDHPFDASEWYERSVHPDDREALDAAWFGYATDPGDEPFDHLTRYYHLDGSLLWIRIRGMALRDGSGRVTRMIGAHTDVTELKRSEQRARILNDGFVRIASHDLGHHLRAISFDVERISDQLGDDASDRINELLDGLRSRISGAGELLRRVGQVSEVDRRPDVRPVPLASVVAQAVGGQQALLDQRHAVVEWQDDLPTVDCDPVLMTTAVMNLVINAVRHNDKPIPRVTITTHCGDGLDLCVTDNGPGIDERQRARIVEPHVHGHHGGSGLGLTIVRHVAELRGGTLGIEDGDDGGARFVLHLP